MQKTKNVHKGRFEKKYLPYKTYQPRIGIAPDIMKGQAKSHPHWFNKSSIQSHCFKLEKCGSIGDPPQK